MEGSRLPKSPSKSTSAGVGSSGWRSTLKPKPKRHKGPPAVVFPVVRSSSSGSSSSGATTTSSTTAPPASASLIQVVHKTRLTPDVRSGSPKPIPSRQVKITSYFSKSGTGSQSSEPEKPSQAPDFDFDVPSQSLPFAPLVTSTQVGAEDIFLFIQTQPEPENELEEPPEVVPEQPKPIGEQSIELFGSEDEETVAGIDIQAPEGTAAGFMGLQSRSPSPSLISRGAAALQVMDYVAKTPEKRKSPPVPTPVTPEPQHLSPCFEIGEMTMELIRNFDKIPARPGDPPSPGYAYKPDRAIRKKDERARLQGWDCDMCRGYYEAIESQLTAEELQKLKDKCSRHRSKYAPRTSNTPPGYWDVGFPSTQECIEKGYMAIGVRTPPPKPKDKEVDPGSPDLFATPPAAAAPSTPPPARERMPVSPVKPISPFQQKATTSTGGGLRKSKTTPVSASAAAAGWKGVKTNKGVKGKIKKPKATPIPRHAPAATPIPTSPVRPRPPPVSRPEPVASTSKAIPRIQPEEDEDFARALAAFDAPTQETVLDSEDAARFCPLSPSLTPKWPRSTKIIPVPQLKLGRPKEMETEQQRRRRSPGGAGESKEGAPIRRLDL